MTDCPDNAETFTSFFLWPFDVFYELENILKHTMNRKVYPPIFNIIRLLSTSKSLQKRDLAWNGHLKDKLIDFFLLVRPPLYAVLIPAYPYPAPANSLSQVGQTNLSSSSLGKFSRQVNLVELKTCKMNAKYSPRYPSGCWRSHKLFIIIFFPAHLPPPPYARPPTHLIC